MEIVQEATSSLRVVFALSKLPHLHRAYLVAVRFHLILAVCCFSKIRVSYTKILKVVPFYPRKVIFEIWFLELFF